MPWFWEEKLEQVDQKWNGVQKEYIEKNPSCRQPATQPLYSLNSTQATYHIALTSVTNFIKVHSAFPPRYLSLLGILFVSVVGSVALNLACDVK